MDSNSKPRQPHPHQALNPMRVRKEKRPGRYADGNGLYLVVDESGAKRWLLRTVVHGKRRDIGLGSARLVTLAEAREHATALRRLARDGGDPLAERRRAKRVVPTFQKAAEQVHDEHAKAWKNEKHKEQWLNTLKTYVFPHFGDRTVDRVDAADVLKALSPIWLTRPETARRVRQRIGTVLEWAKASGFRADANPVDGVSKALPKQSDLVEHHDALAYAELADFLPKLRAANAGESAKFALEFLILTATRTSEVLDAAWAEIDVDRKLWIIPAARMKARREHRIPLAPRCIEILAHAKELAAGSAYVFPGRSPDKPMSNMVFLMLLRRLRVAVTAHGFRSTFRDWARERTNFPRDICEAALAHGVRNETEAAYLRGDLLDKRRELMEAWAAFATRTPAQVIPLHAGAEGARER
jgi:integrase